jgi:hypothetical protein
MVTTNRLHHHDASNGNSGHGSAHHGSSPVSSTEFSAPTKGKPQHQPHAHGTFHHSLYLILLLDGVGLAIIAACTILDGMEVWNDFFNEYFAENFAAMAFWFSGRSCQVMGLLLLIMYAATFQMFPELERCGMLMLTIGPVLNISSCSIFDNQIDNYFLYNRGWLISELVELIGIGILDISMIETLPEIYVLLAELVGFLVLMISATFDFEYTIDDDFPSLGIHFDIGERFRRVASHKSIVCVHDW